MLLGIDHLDEPAETNSENLSEKIHCIDDDRTDTAFKLSDSLEQINSRDKCISRPLEKKDTEHEFKEKYTDYPENKANTEQRHRPKFFELGIHSK